MGGIGRSGKVKMVVSENKTTPTVPAWILQNRDTERQEFF
jgi:hypothetical protein